MPYKSETRSTTQFGIRRADNHVLNAGSHCSMGIASTALEQKTVQNPSSEVLFVVNLSIIVRRLDRAQSPGNVRFW